MGYTGDLSFIQKKEEKREQHINLVSLLRGKGWTIEKNSLSRPIVLGVEGAMYTAYMPHKPSAPSSMLGEKKRQHIVNLANLFFSVHAW